MLKSSSVKYEVKITDDDCDVNGDGTVNVTDIATIITKTAEK